MSILDADSNRSFDFGAFVHPAQEMNQEYMNRLREIAGLERRRLLEGHWPLYEEASIIRSPHPYDSMPTAVGYTLRYLSPNVRCLTTPVLLKEEPTGTTEMLPPYIEHEHHMLELFDAVTAAPSPEPLPWFEFDEPQTCPLIERNQDEK